MLLSTVRERQQLKPLVTRGAHNSISACSLPTSLPDDIIDAMNMMFGQQLRTQLVRFMASNVMRLRSQTATSGRLSIDTIEVRESSQEPEDLDKEYERLFGGD